MLPKSSSYGKENSSLEKIGTADYCLSKQLPYWWKKSENKWPILAGWLKFFADQYFLVTFFRTNNFYRLLLLPTKSSCRFFLLVFGSIRSKYEDEKIGKFETMVIGKSGEKKNIHNWKYIQNQILHVRKYISLISTNQ